VPKRLAVVLIFQWKITGAKICADPKIKKTNIVVYDFNHGLAKAFSKSLTS